MRRTTYFICLLIPTVSALLGLIALQAFWPRIRDFISIQTGWSVSELEAFLYSNHNGIGGMGAMWVLLMIISIFSVGMGAANTNWKPEPKPKKEKKEKRTKQRQIDLLNKQCEEWDRITTAAIQQLRERYEAISQEVEYQRDFRRNNADKICEMHNFLRHWLPDSSKKGLRQRVYDTAISAFDDHQFKVKSEKIVGHKVVALVGRLMRIEEYLGAGFQSMGTDSTDIEYHMREMIEAIEAASTHSVPVHPSMKDSNRMKKTLSGQDPNDNPSDWHEPK